MARQTLWRATLGAAESAVPRASTALPLARNLEALDLGTSSALSLASKFRGVEPKLADMTCALLSKDVYGPPAINPMLTWKPVGEDRLAKLGIDPRIMSTRSGFQARLYEDPDLGGILAYKGTSSARDWLANLKQGAGLDSPQHNESVLLAKLAQKAYGQDLIFVGHSKGGGQAALASAVTGNTAITFNAAGVHDKTLTDLGLNPEKVREILKGGQVRAYSVAEEILTRTQENWQGWVPTALGHQIKLDDPNPRQGLVSYVPGNKSVHDVKLQFMSNVIDGLTPYLDPLARTRAMEMLGSSDPLYKQALQAIEAAGPEKFNIKNPRELQNAAAAAMVVANANGLERIDGVMPSLNGKDFFVMQGDSQNPAHQRVSMNTAGALAQPLQQSILEFMQARDHAPHIAAAQDLTQHRQGPHL
jgi:hypothetical protein